MVLQDNSIHGKAHERAARKLDLFCILCAAAEGFEALASRACNPTGWCMEMKAISSNIHGEPDQHGYHAARLRLMLHPTPQQGCLEKDLPQRHGSGGSRRASTPGGVYVCATITVFGGVQAAGDDQGEGIRIQANDVRVLGRDKERRAVQHVGIGFG